MYTSQIVNLKDSLFNNIQDKLNKFKSISQLESTINKEDKSYIIVKSEDFNNLISDLIDNFLESIDTDLLEIKEVLFTPRSVEDFKNKFDGK